MSVLGSGGQQVHTFVPYDSFNPGVKPPGFSDLEDYGVGDKIWFHLDSLFSRILAIPNKVHEWTRFHQLTKSL